tara:strand:- start:52 stop:522 length:471 start_codon:yes stop_codon:yes gene_type:complete
MASLQVTISESVTLNNQPIDLTHTKTISGVNDIFRRIVTIAAGDDVTVLLFKTTTAIAEGALDLNNVKYFRVTNLDSSNSVNMSLQMDTDEDNSAADAQCTILLEAGKSFMMGAADEAIQVHDSSATISTALTDLESILIDPGSNEVQVEVFAATS